MNLFVKKVENACNDIDQLRWGKFSPNGEPLLIHPKKKKTNCATLLATIDAIIWTTKGPGKITDFFLMRSFPPNIGYDRFFSYN